MPAGDHLIERAAALLQGGAIAKAIPALPPDTVRETVAEVPAAPSAHAPADHKPVQAEAQAAVLVPPTQPTRPAVPQPASAQPAPVQQQAPVSLDLLQAGGMVVARGGRTRISEEYRIVLARVLRALRDEPGGAGMSNLLMVTSAKPGEGKSFTALNLAGSIAQHTAEKVLLIDLDAKVRPISVLLGAGDGPGFYDLVSNPGLRPEGVVRATGIGNLQFLPVGRRTPEIDGQLTVHPITTAIARLARHYPKHVVILDAPPCLSTSDPSTIAPIVGQVVMVIEAERTQRTEVEAALELIRICPTITMLLNKVRLTTSHTFGAYDYYGNYS